VVRDTSSPRRDGAAGWLRQTVAAVLRESTRFRLRQHSPGGTPAPEPPPGAATLESSPLATAPLGAGPLGPAPLASAPLGARPLGPAPLGAAPRDAGAIGAALWGAFRFEKLATTGRVPKAA